MKVAVSYNKEGEITLMFDPSKLNGGNASIGYEPAPGENHRVLDLPQPLEGKRFTELAPLLRVNTKEPTPKLEVKA
jgi:hypothetical protein